MHRFKQDTGTLIQRQQQAWELLGLTDKCWIYGYRRFYCISKETNETSICMIAAIQIHEMCWDANQNLTTRLLITDVVALENINMQYIFCRKIG